MVPHTHYILRQNELFWCPTVENLWQAHCITREQQTRSRVQRWSSEICFCQEMGWGIIGGEDMSGVQKEKEKLREKDVLTFAAFIASLPESIRTSWGSFSSPQLAPNLIISMLKEQKSDLCWKEVALQERHSPPSTPKIQWKCDFNLQTDKETLHGI